MISMQQQMQKPNKLQPLMTPMPSTAPSTNSAPQHLSGTSVEFQLPIDKNLSSDDE
jgi:hypothetical protein